jgi:ring-1,2-phenylacetyl-CoA epoxidase subunit PaaD
VRGEGDDQRMSETVRTRGEGDDERMPEIARTMALTVERVRAILDSVKDPEVPVVSVIELGIVRDVSVDGTRVAITITPTYSGCPAMREIEQDIRAALTAAGIGDVTLETVYAPAWTTDWIGADAREKLRRYGIAPPGRAEHGGLVMLAHRRADVACPRCGSHDTALQSEFGSTACKAIHVCNACREPFDEFKAF